MKNYKDCRIELRICEEDKLLLCNLAEKYNMSVSNYIRLLIEKALFSFKLNIK